MVIRSVFQHGQGSSSFLVAQDQAGVSLQDVFPPPGHACLPKGLGNLGFAHGEEFQERIVGANYRRKLFPRRPFSALVDGACFLARVTAPQPIAQFFPEFWGNRAGLLGKE